MPVRQVNGDPLLSNKLNRGLYNWERMRENFFEGALCSFAAKFNSFHAGTQGSFY